MRALHLPERHLHRLLPLRLCLLRRLLRLRLVLRKLFPALAGKRRNTLGPVRIELRALILLEERLALDAIAFGKPQQTTFILQETLVDVVELLDQKVDAVLVERQRLDRADQPFLEFLVAAFLSRLYEDSVAALMARLSCCPSLTPSQVAAAQTLVANF